MSRFLFQVTMAEGVRKVFVEKVLGGPTEEAEAKYEDLRLQGRYVEEIFGTEED